MSKRKKLLDKAQHSLDNVRRTGARLYTGQLDAIYQYFRALDDLNEYDAAEKRRRFEKSIDDSMPHQP